MIIVEYCRFGNLQAYLISHRSVFVNFVDQFGNMQLLNEMDYNYMSRYTSQIICTTLNTFTLICQYSSDYFGYGLKLEDNQLQSQNSVENQRQEKGKEILKFTGANKLAVNSINFLSRIKIQQ